MSTFRIENRTFTLADGDVPKILAGAHARRERPVCLCRKPPPVMYVARVGARFILKRMPNTGALHAPTCESYEPPPELSGLGELQGAAIQENIEEGVTTLRLGFGLSKQPGRTTPEASGVESDTVKSEGKKLTLRATLHYLWEQAGFHRWTPAMRDKRNWAVIRKYLMLAAQDKRAKGGGLEDMLFLPEPFRLDDKDAIARRRATKLAPLHGTSTTQKLMIVVGEIKEIRDGRNCKIVSIRHLPDMPLVMDTKMHTKVEKRFAAEFDLVKNKEDFPGCHLMMIGTFGVNPRGIATLEEVGLMIVNEQWVPFETDKEYYLLQALQDAERPYVKGLRYNLDREQPLAFGVISDCEPAPVALYLIPSDASGAYTNALRELIEQSSMPPWYWHPEIEKIPPLPERVGYVAPPLPEPTSVPAVSEPEPERADVDEYERIRAADVADAAARNLAIEAGELDEDSQDEPA